MFLVIFLIGGYYAQAAELTFKRDTIAHQISYPDSLNKKGLYWVAGTSAGLYTASLWYIHQIWYKDRDFVPFHFYNDNAGYLQIDKFGHATTAFQESSISYYAYRKVGLSKKKALLYGGLTGFFLQLPIEVFDGFNEGWGFSWGDVAANGFGSALLIGQEYFFDQQIVTMKFSYWPSVYADMANGYLGKSALEGLSKDYNGHTYWFSANLKQITKQHYLPGWLNFAVGYSAGGMFGEFRNIVEYKGVPIPQTERYRQLFLSLDVDWTRIPTNSLLLEILFKGLNIVKVPFPAVQFNTKGKVAGHWLYF